MIAAFFVHLFAAILATTNPKLPPQLLMAVAWIESGWRDPPPVSKPHGNRFPIYCGPLQTAAMSWAQCRKQSTDILHGYRLGVQELETWLADPRVKGNRRKMLKGHGCGNAGLVAHKCHVNPADGRGYEDRVLRALSILNTLGTP